MEEPLIEEIEIKTLEMTIRGVKYAAYCKRLNKKDADMIAADLVQCGRKAAVTKGKDDYYVWWRK